MWIMGPAESETKNGLADEGHQQFAKETGMTAIAVTSSRKRYTTCSYNKQFIYHLGDSRCLMLAETSFWSTSCVTASKATYRIGFNTKPPTHLEFL
jgi:serine/threonine protein phosphatase PrpC